MSYQALQQALATKGFEIVDVSQTSAMQVRITGRARHADNWKLVMHRLLFCPATAWTLDLSYWGVAKKGENKVVFFWRLIFQCKQGEIAMHYPEIARIVLSAPKSNKVEVMSFPLPGANPHRYDGRHGARVGPAGKVLTGPDLLRRR